ncbi:MAG TPA: class I SAM-dependent methyltransferase [Candidatus Pygmaiobacter gallistercoris]|nr:class I SAM-dependent methyltransferase [Candidatus Pygmaiobacter gallistercoris]
MLERMGEFFDRRLEGYEEHQLTAIAAAEEFYPFTASCLPMGEGSEVLDLGCGTGLELEYYFAKNPTARVTCIDLAEGMLAALQRKFADRAVTVRQGSYFDLPLGEARYDAVVSVESLHHFPAAQKIGLYRKIAAALKKDGFFLLTDYFAPSDAEEQRLFCELARLKKEQGITDGGFYHFDTPLTVEHEIGALRAAGFSSVRLLRRWAGDTRTLRAEK